MDRDEHYILDLCDEVLGELSQRQHKLPFLLGDMNAKGMRRHLPVDAYYPNCNLVVEYRELQHSEPVSIMDRRTTLSGVSRGEQRRKYDQRRRDVLAAYQIRLVELDYSMFVHDGRKRLTRDRVTDARIIRHALGG